MKTGALKGFKVTAPNGRAQTSHGIGRDANGIMWLDTGGMLGRIDPATEAFEFFRTPFGSATTTSGQIDIAPNGNVWMSARRGALMFDPKTRKFRFYPDKTIGDGQTYGAAADADGNGWWTQFNMDMVVHADAVTGRTWEFPMYPPIGWRSRSRRKTASSTTTSAATGFRAPSLARAVRRPPSLH